MVDCGQEGQGRGGGACSQSPPLRHLLSCSLSKAAGGSGSSQASSILGRVHF